MASTSTNSGLFAGLPPLPQVPDTEPSRIALDAFRIAIAEQVSKTLGLDVDKVYEGISFPAKGCDSNVAIPRFRLKGNPKELAQKVADEFVPNDYIAKAEVAPGQPFVNFHFHSPTFTRLVLQQINELNHLSPQPSTSSSPAATSETHSASNGAVPAQQTSATGYGTNNSGVGKRVVFDYSSPNIAKPFHAGHLRSTIIGQFLANLFVANGWQVTRLNYLGDWGKQFGLLAIGFEKYGSEEELQKDAIKHLYDVYVAINKEASEELDAAVRAQREERIREAAKKGEKAYVTNERGEKLEVTLETPLTNAETNYGNAQSATHNAARAMFKRMEDGDPEALGVWKRFRDMSIKKCKEVYKRMNIDFDVYGGESTIKEKSIDDAVDILLEKGIVKEDQGALLLNLEKYKLGKTVVRKKDGTKLYITRDIGGAFERYNDYKFDKSIYVVASQQDLNFKQLFKTLELMEVPWAKDLIHVSFGMVTGMSTRKGTAVFLEQILDEAKNVMHEQMKSNDDKYKQIEDPEGTSDNIGITAVKIQDMAGKRGNNYAFDWKRMTSFEGDTGPYLQYAHVRLASVERRSAPEVVLPPPSERAAKLNTDLLTEAKARDIIALLAQYPDVVKKATEVLEPSAVVTFLFRLCHAISSAWEVLLVRGQEQDVALARLWLYVSAREVVAHGLRLLSITPLERM